MSEEQFYFWLLYGFAGTALVIFPVLLFLTPAYGRHMRAGWGPKIDATLGWVVMESPSVLAFGLCAWLGRDQLNTVTLAFLIMWELHYVNRSWIFPFRRSKRPDDVMPLAIAASSFSFTSINGYLNGRWLFHFAPAYTLDWLSDPRFLVGTLLFGFGFFVNLQSDDILRRLRKPGETGYKIPHGGFYRWVSSPNYFGEIIEWFGFALATWSLPALVFAVWTVANLAPRAGSNHRWYIEKFNDYPRSRKALIPFVW